MKHLTEIDEEIARGMKKRGYKIYKSGNTFLVKDSDLDNYTEDLLDEEFDSILEQF